MANQNYLLPRSQLCYHLDSTLSQSLVPHRMKRFVNWIFFNFLFALIPLVSAWILRVLVGKPIFDLNNDYPEFLFFSLMVCATTVGDLRYEKSKSESTGYLVIELLLFFFVVAIAIFFGALKFMSLTDPDSTSQRTSMSGILYFAFVVFIVSLLTQISLISSPGRRRY